MCDPQNILSISFQYRVIVKISYRYRIEMKILISHSTSADVTKDGGALITVDGSVDVTKDGRALVTVDGRTADVGADVTVEVGVVTIDGGAAPT